MSNSNTNLHIEAFDCRCKYWASDRFDLIWTGNGHHHNCEHYKPHEFKVFKLNENDWYVGRTLSEAIEAAEKNTGLKRSELVDEDAREVTPPEMMRLEFYDDNGSIRSFAEQFMRLVHAGEMTAPGIFASTEY